MRRNCLAGNHCRSLVRLWHVMVRRSGEKVLHMAQAERISISGKLFSLAARKWYVKGVIYGPFAPNSEGPALPERPRLLKDLAHIADLGGNCLRLYFPPPLSLLDDALERGLRVMIDVPWEKHRCFFED